MPSRPSLTHARRVRALLSITAACTAVIVVVLAVTGGLVLTGRPTPFTVTDGPAPWDFTTPAWDAALGGDEEITQARFDELATVTDPDLAGATDEVRALAERVVAADLTGHGQDDLSALAPGGIGAYWPPAAASGAQPSAQCADVDVLVAAPAALPVEGSQARTLGLFTRYAKTVVVFTGTCAGETFTLAYPGIRYVYAGWEEEQERWVPLRYWQVPSAAELDALPGATEPYDWELAEVPDACSTTTLVRARIAVADALGQMCAAAAADGVELRVLAGYRTRAEQASAFGDAVRAYGSPEAARRYVAFADETVCTSKHCSGLGLNIDPTPRAIAWLNATVGCVAADGRVEPAVQCPSGQTAVRNAARWGFSMPLATSPGYVEFTLALPEGGQSSLATPNCAPAGVPVANQVAAIFRCRLAREGIVGAPQAQVIAEAVTVSRCESGWNPAAAAFGGRFTTSVNPSTGRTYTQRGVFMVSAELADAGWVAGGRDALSDSVANINAAASLWLATRDWTQFGCATGDAGGFEAGPVLPQYGGPALPQWATQY